MQISVEEFYTQIIALCEACRIKILTDFEGRLDTVRDIDLLDHEYQNFFLLRNEIEDLAQQGAIGQTKTILNEYSTQLTITCLDGYALIDILPHLTVRGLYVSSQSSILGDVPNTQIQLYRSYRKKILKQGDRKALMLLIQRSVQRKGLLRTLLNVLLHYFLILVRFVKSPGWIQFTPPDEAYKSMRNRLEIVPYRGLFRTLKDRYNGKVIVLNSRSRH